MKLTDYAISKGGTAKIGCPGLAVVAEVAGCSPSTLYMIATGHKQPSAKLAVSISKATGGLVTPSDLRPDVFGPPANDDAAVDAAA